MSIARLVSGPLDGQVVPLDSVIGDSYIVPYGEGQLVYRRQGDAQHTGAADGPTEETFVFVESTENISPGDDSEPGDLAQPW
ncbi:response regulator [Microbacterium sp. X-17]|uniref:response regulator n=1 Tax=Microbacterium sp. X-17 TaxID=3144404 RepID=UPI0031F49257